MDSLFRGRGRHTPHYAGGYGLGRAPVLELLVPMCCAKCEEKVYEEMMELRGVQGVMVDREAQRVIVHGFVDPVKALKKAKKVKRDSQIWSGEQYGRDFSSSSKYRRSAYRSPSLYRSSSLDYQPPLYRAPAYEYRQPSVYRSSYNRYTPPHGPSYGSSYDPAYGPSYGPRYGPSYGSSYSPSYGPSSGWPPYDDMYSHVITNPYYVQHIESEYY